MLNILLLFLSLSHLRVSGEDKEQNMTCPDYKEYDGVNVTALQGSWKANELVLHLVDQGITEYSSCPVINITEVHVPEKSRKVYGPSTQPAPYHHSAVFQLSWYRQHRHLRLVWDEDGSDVEYSLYFRNDSVGFWNSEGDQNGTLPGYRSYRQFTGTVQVLKAVGDHLLLHFCQAPAPGYEPQLFSVLLAREPRKLQRWEIESAHALLLRKNLSVSSRRLVCGNAAVAAVNAAVLTALALLLSQLV